jgi:hypothetical protein
MAANPASLQQTSPASIPPAVVLLWKQFSTFREARKAFKAEPCIYAVTDAMGRILKIGESGNLWRRYWGGTGYTLDAALHGSGNLVFAAPAPPDRLERCAIEAALIFRCQPPYCIQRLSAPSAPLVRLEHHGQVPSGLRYS